MPLHLSKLAYGCASLAELEAAVARRAEAGRVIMTTRYRPKRAGELAGGSLYWIIRHQIVARASIIEFADAPDGRTDIVLEARVIPVSSIPRRAHQGWRYLEDGDVPADLDFGGAVDADMPAALVAELSGMGLV